MGETIETNPFLKKRGIDQAKLHVMFLPESPVPADLKQFEGLTTAPDQSRCLGKEIYLYLPNGVGASSLANNPMGKRLWKRTTMRNWRTVSKLYQMCLDCG
jgi:uncharacterized protein (DUF1697 family)